MLFRSRRGRRASLANISWCGDLTGLRRPVRSDTMASQEQDVLFSFSARVGHGYGASSLNTTRSSARRSSWLRAGRRLAQVRSSERQLRGRRKRAPASGDCRATCMHAGQEILRFAQNDGVNRARVFPTIEATFQRPPPQRHSEERQRRRISFIASNQGRKPEPSDDQSTRRVRDSSLRLE